MATEPTPADPAGRDWLETSVKYEGEGRAEFTDPPGVIEGPAVVRIDRRGEQSVTIDATDAPPGGLFFYIKGSVPAVNLRRHGMFNPCSSVTVKTQSGVYTAAERVVYQGGATRAKPDRVRLRPLRGHYEIDGGAEAAHWVLPLSNFILQHWPQPTERLDGHPLRVFPPTSPPAELRDDDREQARRLLRERQRVVLFEVNGRHDLGDRAIR
jgi:hypothetical protein